MMLGEQKVPVFSFAMLLGEQKLPVFSAAMMLGEQKLPLSFLFYYFLLVDCTRVVGDLISNQGFSCLTVLGSKWSGTHNI